jgi:hypothetical protein
MTQTPEQQICSAVVEAFLETGKALDAPEIAKKLGWSESKVRRILRAHGGSVDGVAVREEGRASYSRAYRGMEAGAHRVSVYRPTLEALRALVLELRAASVVGAAAPVQDPK